ncbi:molybdopterin molybdenumtransferase, partial [Amycolatopsis sp. NPDC000740]
MTDSLDSTPATPAEEVAATEPAVQAVAAAETAEIIVPTEESAESGDFRSVDEQIALTLDAAVRPRPVRVAISEAQGLLCAEEVVAEHALPGFDQ